MDVSYWGLSQRYQENLRFFVSQVTPVPTLKKSAIQVAHRSPIFFLFMSVPIFLKMGGFFVPPFCAHFFFFKIPHFFGF